MNKSIRYYYFTSIATILVASILIMGLIQTFLATTYFRDEKEVLLEQVVTGVTHGIKEGHINNEDNSLQAIGYMAHVASAVVFICDSQGNIVFTTTGGPELGVQVSPSILRELASTGRFFEKSKLDGLFAENYYTFGGVLQQGVTMPAGFVFAASDSTGLKAYMSNMLSSFILSAGLVLLLSSALALILSNRTVTPLRHISNAARQFGEGNYNARVPVEGDKELAQLAITFNNMADSFQATDQSRRSFMGNIAHELRTPMTSIKGFIDGMLDGTIPENQRDKYLAIVSEEVGRLARLTKNMLDISKLEAGEYTPNTTVFDIWEPLASVFLSSEQRLEEKQITVEGFETDTPVMVSADEDFVHQILFNLIDNAIKFTNEGGSIHINVESNKGFSTITIRNTGYGIPAAALPYIFDRFYKEDKSRGINAKGSGLGLHICKVLVGLMGGRIWVKSEENEWTEFAFTIPNGVARKKANISRRN